MRFAIAIDVFNSISEGKDGTLSLNSSPLPVDGYFVGGNGKPLILNVAEANTRQAADSIREFVEALSSEYVGWWLDTETDKLYVDGTDWFATREEAAKASFDRHEIAFWGVAEGREFRYQYVDGE